MEGLQSLWLWRLGLVVFGLISYLASMFVVAARLKL